MTLDAAPAAASDTPVHEPAGAAGLLRALVCEAFYEWEIDGDVIHWSGNLESLFGYQRGEVRNNSEWWREHVHPDDFEPVSALSRTMAARDATQAHDPSLRRKRYSQAKLWPFPRIAARDKADNSSKSS